MKIKFLAYLLFPLILTGCASVNSYHEPSTTGNQSLATISGSSTRGGVFAWTNTLISAIDNKPVNMLLWSNESKIRVVPGAHLFVVDAGFNRSFSNGPYSGTVEVRAFLKPGINYRAVCKPENEFVNVWIEDGSGQRVSDIISGKYAATSIPVVVPIYLPG